MVPPVNSPLSIRRLLVLFALPALVHAQTRYTLTNLGNLGGANLYPYSINASGAVVGSERVGIQLATLPFLYSGGVMTRLSSLGGNTDLNDAKGINTAGTIVGHSYVVSSNTYRGWVISGGVLTDLGTGITANAINDAGIIVGSSGGRAFMVSGATKTALGSLGGSDSEAFGINAAGVIVGTAATAASSTTHAFRYANGVMTDLGTLGTGALSYAYGINSAGTVVGSALPSATAAVGVHAVIFSGGNIIDLDPPGTNSTVFGSAAYGINSSGTVVGTYGADRAFVYTPAGGLIDLNTVVTNLAASGFGQLREAYAINDSGQIVGRGNFGGGFAAFRLDVDVTPPAPTIATGPKSHTVTPGTTVVFSVSATSTGLSYQWLYNNAEISGATTASYSVTATSNAQAGGYAVRVSNAGGTVTSAPGTLTINASASGRLINLSLLTSVAGGSDAFTMGYSVGGAGTVGNKPLVIRAAGPSLAQFSVGSPLDDPKFELFTGPTKTGENDNWGGGDALRNAMTAVGAFAFNGPTSLDAAVTADVPAGGHTVIVSAASGHAGAVIAEIYDASPAGSFAATTPRLVNVSVLKPLGTGFTAGFVIGGTASKTVLVRAVGPTLGTTFAIAGSAPDPQLTLFAEQTVIGQNNDWGGTATLLSVFGQVGAFTLPTGSKDAALVATLAPGSYTVQVSAANGVSGLVIVEVYEVP